MEYSKFGNIDKNVSRFILGTFSIVDQAELLEQEFKLLDTALELGINTLDTAQGYGRGSTEIALGKYFKSRGNRDKFFVISKACHPAPWRKRVTPFDLATDLHDALAKMNAEYIDLYMLHRDDPDMAVGPMMDAFHQYQKEGKIKAYGVSNWTVERIQQANDYAKKQGYDPFIVSSPNYSLAEQYAEPWAPGCVTIAGPENEAARRWYAENKMPVLAYSSMARGLFSGRITREMWEKKDPSLDPVLVTGYLGESNFARLDRATELAKEKGVAVAQIALAFMLCGEMDVFPIMGAANREEMLSSIGSLDVKLTPGEVAWLDLKQDAR